MDELRYTDRGSGKPERGEKYENFFSGMTTV